MHYKIVLILLIAASPFIHAKELALTFDDAPRSATGYFNGPTRAKTLLEELKKHNILKAAFFSVSQKLDQEGMQRLRSYSDAGHIIANHTHSHPDFNQLNLQEYVDDVTRVLRYNPGRVGEIALDKGQDSDLWHRTLDQDYLRERFRTEILGSEATEDF